jgi:hypothetical protein
MERLEEGLPAGAIPSFDVERGCEVVFVTPDGQLGAWRAPYCGPGTFRAPRFRATREQLLQLEEQVTAAAPEGSKLRVLNLAPPDADGVGEWAVTATAG